MKVVKLTVIGLSLKLLEVVDQGGVLGKLCTVQSSLVPRPAQLSIALQYGKAGTLQATESWTGPGDKAKHKVQKIYSQSIDHTKENLLTEKWYLYKVPLPQFPEDCSPTGTSISPLTESAHVHFRLYLYIMRLRWLKQTPP